MSKKGQIGVKPLFFKSIAVLLGCCYLLGPLEMKISEHLHLLSHSFQQQSENHPHLYSNHGQTSEQDKIKDPGIIETPHHHDHSSDGDESGSTHHRLVSHKQETHQHNILAFVGGLLKSSSTDQHHKDKIELRASLDKHIIQVSITVPILLQELRVLNFSNKKKNLLMGVLHQIFSPPKRYPHS